MIHKGFRDETFYSRIPLELDDDDLDHLKMEHVSWSSLLDEDSQIAPPYSIMGKPLFGISSHDHFQQALHKHQAYDLFEKVHLELDFSTPNLLWLKWCLADDHEGIAISYSSKYTSHRLNSHILMPTYSICIIIFMASKLESNKWSSIIA